ncbi:hypothetical protein KPH14_004139 [Odynerus spinipes]|uniref:Odorant receptor n=1 Tax=Odynerus spinipes TaxID=1348599 RepID=A0AAD9RYC6_9HYME|nr:hypothetical protein KPH14_004139 [Odynerus spinipes]
MSLGKGEDDDAVKILMLYKTLLGLLGLWPLEARSARSLIRWCLAVASECVTITVLSLEMYRQCRDSEDVFDALLVNVSSTTSLCKLLLYRTSHRYKRELLESMIEDWSSPRKDPRTREIATSYAYTARTVSVTYLYLGFVSAIFIILKGLPLQALLTWPTETTLNQTDATTYAKFILQTYCVFDPSSRHLYVLIMAAQMIQLFVNCLSQCIHDGFFFAQTMHLCGQFKILSVGFSDLGKNERYRPCDLAKLISRHSRLLRLSVVLERAYCYTILAHLCLFGLLLSIEGLHLLLCLKANDVYGVGKHSVVVVTIFVSLLFYAVSGNFLKSHSEDVANAVYDSSWYDFDERESKNLIFLILRANVARKLTAGKLIDIDLQTFREIVKISASYMSVLRIMLDE